MISAMVMRISTLAPTNRTEAACRPELLPRLRQDQEPAAEQKHFEVARLDTGVALDDRVDRVEAFAEVTGDQNFAASDAHKKRCRSVFQAERVVQSGH